MNIKDVEYSQIFTKTVSKLTIKYHNLLFFRLHIFCNDKVHVIVQNQLLWQFGLVGNVVGRINKVK